MSAVTVYLLLIAVLFSLHVVESSSSDGGGDRPSGRDYDTAKYPICGEQYQSPIDIKLSDTKYDAQYTRFEYVHEMQNISFEYINKIPVGDRPPHVRVSLLNNNNAVGIKGGGLSGFYKLEQFHFHWGTENEVGSEHLVDGHAYPMEIHLVHYNTIYDNISVAVNMSDGLAIVGTFVEIGQENNPGFAEVIKYFPNITAPGSSIISGWFTLGSFLPDDRDEYYRYNGSIAVPPCYQSVILSVYKHPVKISQRQLTEFHGLSNANPEMQNNFRRVQPLNGRTVYRSYEELETTTAADSTATTEGAAAFTCSAFVLFHSAVVAYLSAKMMAI